MRDRAAILRRSLARSKNRYLEKEHDMKNVVLVLIGILLWSGSSEAKSCEYGDDPPPGCFCRGIYPVCPWRHESPILDQGQAKSEPSEQNRWHPVEIYKQGYGDHALAVSRENHQNLAGGICCSNLPKNATGCDPGC